MADDTDTTGTTGTTDNPVDTTPKEPNFIQKYWPHIAAAFIALIAVIALIIAINGPSNSQLKAVSETATKANTAAEAAKAASVKADETANLAKTAADKADATANLAKTAADSACNATTELANEVIKTNTSVEKLQLAMKDLATKTSVVALKKSVGKEFEAFGLRINTAQAAATEANATANEAKAANAAVLKSLANGDYYADGAWGKIPVKRK